MKAMKVITCAALLIMIFTTVQANNVTADPTGSNIENLQDQYEPDSQTEGKHPEEVWKRKKYWKLGAGYPGLERTDGGAMTWSPKFSVSLQRGKTAYLHSKPVGGILKFGIDYGFMDLNYSRLQLNTVGSDGIVPGGYGTRIGSTGGFDDIVSDEPSGSITSILGIDLSMHKLEYGLHVGPSITVNPWNHLMVAAYFHVRPTASGIIENDRLSYGFGLSTSAGIAVSYKAISIGVEGLWGTIKYTQASFNDEAEDEAEIFNTENFNLKQKGPRFYIAIRL